MLDYTTGQNKTGMVVQVINTLRSCCIATANTLEEYQPLFGSKVRSHGNLPVIAVTWRWWSLFPCCLCACFCGFVASGLRHNEMRESWGMANFETRLVSWWGT